MDPEDVLAYDAVLAAHGERLPKPFALKCQAALSLTRIPDSKQEAEAQVRQMAGTASRLRSSMGSSKSYRVSASTLDTDGSPVIYKITKRRKGECPRRRLCVGKPLMLQRDLITGMVSQQMATPRARGLSPNLWNLMRLSCMLAV